MGYSRVGSNPTRSECFNESVSIVDYHMKFGDELKSYKAACCVKMISKISL